MKKYYLKNYNRFVNLIWLAIAIMFTIQFGVRMMPIYQAVLVAMSVVLVSFPLTTHLSTRLLKRAMQRNKMFLFAVQFIAYSIIVGVLLFFVLRLFIYLESIHVLQASTLYNSQNSLTEDFVSSLVTALFINFGFCGLRFYEENLRLQKNLIESQLQMLQAQINPHFMFNVLNHINVLIRKEPDLASSLLVQYTDILRYQLYSAKEESILIKKEVEFLQNFIEIEKTRWKNSLDVNSTWSVQNESATVYPLLFITFVENAFKHVSRSKTDKGYVNIDFKQQDGQVLLSIVNSKYTDGWEKEAKKDSGIGLENIKQRLNILYPNKYNLQISETVTTYSTTLSIKL